VGREVEEAGVGGRYPYEALQVLVGAVDAVWGRRHMALRHLIAKARPRSRPSNIDVLVDTSNEFLTSSRQLSGSSGSYI
jgi:hypothetical protein